LLAIESVDLTSTVYYDFEVYFEGDGSGNNRIMIWRNGKLRITYSETEAGFLSVRMARFRVYDGSTTTALKGHFSKPFLVLGE